jgi:hypothetical protein
MAARLHSRAHTTPKVRFISAVALTDYWVTIERAMIFPSSARQRGLRPKWLLKTNTVPDCFLE